jgi:hypothetical protein
MDVVLGMLPKFIVPYDVQFDESLESPLIVILPAITSLHPESPSPAFPLNDRFPLG